MKTDKEREEICKARKNSGLSCNGCQYKEGCEILKKEAEELPEDIKPGTKQARIYRMLKEGKKAAEIIKTKEFASESVYIVARKHFPDALAKPQKKEDERMQKALQIVEEYMKVKPETPKEEQPLPKAEVNPKIVMYERIIKEDMNWKSAKVKTMKYLETVKTKLEQGELVEAYSMIQDIIESYRNEIGKEAESEEEE